MNFGARDYDPLTKKFLSADPLGHLSTPDLYSYANGDPINNIDPDGRFASEVYDYTGQAVNDFKDFSARTKDYYSSPPSYSWDDLGRDLQGLGPIGMEIGRGAQLAGEALNYLRAAEFLHRTGVGSAKNQDSNRAQTAGNYRPDRTLPRDKYGNPVPDSSEPHTQLGKQTGRSGEYTQAREWGKDGKLVKDVDFTDHMRPSEHPNPHQRRYIPNPTGGTPKRGKIEPLSYE